MPVFYLTLALCVYATTSFALLDEAENPHCGQALQLNSSLSPTRWHYQSQAEVVALLASIIFSGTSAVI